MRERGSALRASVGAVGGILEELQAVAQPLDRGAGHEDRAFEGVGALAFLRIGDGGEQAVVRRRHHRAGVDEREAAGAVGRLHQAFACRQAWPTVAAC